MMLASRLGCPLSLKTPNMGNPGKQDLFRVSLGVARDTVYRWIDSRGLPAHRVGRFWKFQLSEVDAWVKSGEADVSNGAGSDERFVESPKQGR